MCLASGSVALRLSLTVCTWLPKKPGALWCVVHVRAGNLIAGGNPEVAELGKMMFNIVKGNSPLFEIKKQTVPNFIQSGIAENGTRVIHQLSLKPLTLDRIIGTAPSLPYFGLRKADYSKM
ncbi:hypothetical protein B0T13DRAFT_444893 [Neurospora crassa]|nr:hypothetical protein B0T13DRAFT_444893 [Neurospora crassa]